MIGKPIVGSVRTKVGPDIGRAGQRTGGEGRRFGDHARFTGAAAGHTWRVGAEP